MIVLDVETYSELDLTQVGAYRYAAHRSTELLCMSWWDLSRQTSPKLWIPGDRFPQFRDNTIFAAWNADFEIVILNGRAGRDVGWEHVPLARWYDIQAVAAYNNYPRKLSSAAKFRAKMDPEFIHRKDEVGHRVMLQLSRPRKPSKNNPDTRWTREKFSDKYEILYQYCIQDTLVEKEIHDVLDPLPAAEQELWRQNVLVNRRGWALDRDAVEAAIAVADLEMKVLTQSLRDHTGDPDITPSNVKQISTWLEKHTNKTLPDTKRPTLEAIARNPSVSGHAKEVIRCRLQAGLASIKKYYAGRRVVCDDGRLHGMFMFYAAGTGRYAGSLLQPHNMLRGRGDQPEMIETLLHLNPKHLYLLDDPMVYLSEAMRGILTGGDNDLVACDYSSIEAIVLSWLAQSKDRLTIFREGKIDIYKKTAADIYRVPYDKVTSEKRLVGKIAELALGYAGTHKAFMDFARDFNIDMPQNRAELAVKRWRASNPEIQEYWHDLQEAVRLALGQKTPVELGPLTIQKRNRALCIGLPSGRALYYQAMKADRGLSYLDSRYLIHIDTYGGKLAENVTQAISRDLLCHGMMTLELRGYKIVGSVHDEIIAEGDYEPDTMAKLMCLRPGWAAGIPLRATGWKGYRYRKD